MAAFDGVRDRTAGSFWLIPTVFSAVAVAVGIVLTFVRPEPGTFWYSAGFQGSPADARTLLITVCSAMVTVIALMLGLTVVALQMASTQFSPRLLRSFLRDRPNQVALGVFVATFVYSAAGLFTVGVGTDADEYPRLAVSISLVWLMVSSAMIVYFADHVAHSLQVDRVMLRVQRTVARVIDSEPRRGFEAPVPDVPADHGTVRAEESGYIQAVHPEDFVRHVRGSGVHALLTKGVGEHVVEGTIIARIWWVDGRPGDVDLACQALRDAIRLGPERTLEQDFGIGFRQLNDTACKAMSPAVNDPYTAIQAVEHLSVLFRRIAGRPLGWRRLGDDSGSVTIPGRTFGEYLRVTCGLMRRYAAAEPTVIRAVLGLLQDSVDATDDPRRLRDIDREAELLARAAALAMPERADVERVAAITDDVRRAVAARLPR